MHTADWEYEDWTEAINDFVTEQCVLEKKGFTQFSRLYVEFVLWMKGKILTMRLPSDITFQRAMKQQFADTPEFIGVKDSVVYHFGRKINGYAGIAMKSDRPFDASSALYGMRLSAMQDERGRAQAAMRLRGKRIPIVDKELRFPKPEVAAKLAPFEAALPIPAGYNPENDPRGPLPPQKPWETGEFSGRGQPGFIEPPVNKELRAYLQRLQQTGELEEETASEEEDA